MGGAEQRWEMRAREEKWMGIYDQFSLGRCQPCHQRDDLLQAIWSVSGRWRRWWERVWVWDSSTCLYRRLFEFSWNSNMFALFSMNWKIYKSTPSSPRQSVWCVDILSLEMWVPVLCSLIQWGKIRNQIINCCSLFIPDDMHELHTYSFSLTIQYLYIVLVGEGRERYTN